jgi:formate hydrogenlyase subunit 3/multisubunit Na+/H+ antiporter MnhD subunit
VNPEWIEAGAGWPALLLAATLVPPLLAALGIVAWLRAAVFRFLPWAPLPALALAVAGDAYRYAEWPWLLLGLRLGLDPVGKLFLLFTAVLWLVGGLYARAYLADDARRARFAGFWLVTQGANFGTILALDVPGFYLAYACMTFAAYGLVVHSGTAEARRAGRVYIVLAVAGELLLFAGVVLAAGAAGHIDLRSLGASLAAAGTRDVAVALLLAGFGVKAGVVGLHMWLPLAHPVAPAPASALLSGAIIKLGLLGWLRFLPLGHVALPEWGAACVIAGLAAAFYGVLVGLVQGQAKTILAYSSVSQMGFLTAGIGAGLMQPRLWPATLAALLLYTVHHALAKALLFLGAALARTADARTRRWMLAGLALPALALAGAPFTSGAYAKLALKSVASALPDPWPAALAVLLPLAAVGTTLLMARFLVVLAAPRAEPEHPVRGAVPPVAVLLLAVAAWPFAAGAAAAGSWLAPAALFAAFWPVALGILLAGLVWRAPRRLPYPHIPPGDLLAVVAAAWRYATGVVASHCAPAGARPATAARARQGGRWLASAAERLWQRWAVVGPAWLLLVLLLIGLLAVG